MSMKKDMQLKHMNISYQVKPVFADRSITASQVASLPEKDNKKKAARKEGTVRIIFMDSVSNQSVADVVMTPIAAEQLVHGIKHSLEKLSTELKDLTINQPSPPTREPQTYIG